MEEKDFIRLDNGFDDGADFTTPFVTFVPVQYVDGVHTRNLMLAKEFPIKIMVRSTGHTYYVYGFSKGGMVYTSNYFEGGIPFSSRGLYKGKLGEDFYFI